MNLSRWLQKSISRRVIVNVVLLHAVMMGLVVLDMTTRQQSFMRSQVERDGLALASALAANTPSWLLTNDLVAMNELTRSLEGGSVRLAMVLDLTGRVLASSDPSLFNTVLSDPLSLAALKALGDDDSGHSSYQAWIDDRLDSFSEVTANGVRLGFTRVILDTDPIQSELTSITKNGAFYTLAAIIIGGVFAWAVVRTMARRLERLSQVAESVTAGEFDIHLQPDARGDEVATLNNAFKTMIDALQRQIAALNRANGSFRRLNQLYTMLSQTNQTLIRVRGREDLFLAICKIAVKNGLFRMAWIGNMDAQSGRVAPVAWWGHEEGYLAQLNIALQDRRTGAGPVASAIKQGEHVVVDDIDVDPRMAPWREEALKRGYRSAAAFPIREGDTVTGCFTLYAAEAGFFTSDIVQLLDELSDDISFALDFLAEVDRRARAESELKVLNTELEKRVQDRTQQLENANRELEAFSYSVSHDLRAPLRSIDGFSQILLKNYSSSLDETASGYLQRICRAGQRMGNLIDELLKLSRVTRSEMHREKINLSEMAVQIADELQRNSTNRDVEFSIHDGIWVEGDPQLLRVVLENLLGNAWKFTSKLPNALIEFGAIVGKDGTTEFFVRDNGAGFNPQYAHKLFGAFQRLHTIDEFEGTGIGLATVQRIVHRHGGTVRAEGAVGHGAAFYFRL